MDRNSFDTRLFIKLQNSNNTRKKRRRERESDSSILNLLRQLFSNYAAEKGKKHLVFLRWLNVLLICLN